MAHGPRSLPAFRFWVKAVLACVLVAVTLGGGYWLADRLAGNSRSEQEANWTHRSESWEVIYLQGVRIGYCHIVARPVERDGEPLLRVDSEQHLFLRRFGERMDQTLKTSTLEDPAGELLEFESDLLDGSTRTVVRGRLQAQQLQLEMTTQGDQRAWQIPGPPGVRGFRAIELSLERQPIAPGERREFKMILPLLYQVAEVELSARAQQETEVLGWNVSLVPVDSRVRLADGKTMISTYWVDSSGRTIKSEVHGADQVTFRTSREIALQSVDEESTLDVGVTSIIKPAGAERLAGPLQRATYRVDLAQGDPARVFATAANQSVHSLTPRAAQIEVQRFGPQDVAASPAAEPVADEYRLPNAILQSDDPRIEAMARKAKGDAEDPRSIAMSLEQFVHDTVAKKGLAPSFATAAEVAASPQGDCTEHAVLLAALARACDIPSRVVTGLVYSRQLGGFGFHMWTELYLHGQWIPLDATLGAGGISPTHLKLADSSLTNADVYGVFLPVSQVLGRLSIRVD